MQKKLRIAEPPVDDWDAALKAASTTAAARAWRQRLAVEIRRASGARFALVATCPPDNPVEAQLDVVPAGCSSIIEEFHGRFLARVERAGDGIARAAITNGEAYAPLLETRQHALVRALLSTGG